MFTLQPVLSTYTGKGDGDYNYGRYSNPKLDLLTQKAKTEMNAEARLVYVQDAYTISDRFPNANVFDRSKLPDGSGLADDDFDYIRNSVKVVVDAYDGTTTFYAADPSDPILRAYERVFPQLFKPLDQMPADLQAHLRVPEELFDVQTRMFGTYHVQDPSIFFQGSDRWEVPTIARRDVGQLPEEAYYVVMRLPGEQNPEFLLIMPFTPLGKNNLVSWLAARNDGSVYGQYVSYVLPKDKTIFGPQQVATFIDDNPNNTASNFTALLSSLPNPGSFPAHAASP